MKPPHELSELKMEKACNTESHLIKKQVYHFYSMHVNCLPVSQLQCTEVLLGDRKINAFSSISFHKAELVMVVWIRPHGEEKYFFPTKLLSQLQVAWWCNKHDINTHDDDLVIFQLT